MRRGPLLWPATSGACVSVSGLTNGFGGVSSEQELDGAPGRKATPRRRCVSESSICSISSPLCDTRWAPARPPLAFGTPGPGRTLTLGYFPCPMLIGFVEFNWKWETTT